MAPEPKAPQATIAFFNNARAVVEDGVCYVNSPKVDMLVGMARRGFRVVICVPTADRPRAGGSWWQLPDELELYRLPNYGDYTNLITRAPLLLLRALPRLLWRSRKWDAMGGMAPGVFGLVLVGVGLIRRKIVFMYLRGDISVSLPHELHQEQPLVRKLIQLSFQPLEICAQLLARAGIPTFAIGQELARKFAGPHVYVLENYGRPDVIGDQIPAIPGPVDRLLYVGRLSREKGLDVLLQAIAEVENHGLAIHLDAVGDGPERARLEDLACRLNLASRVTFHGHVSDPLALRSLYLGCGTLVVPSRSEGVPMALLEGMALGRVVVASRVGGIPSVVGAERDALLVPPDDPAALAQAIERVISHPELAHALASEALLTGAKLTAQAQSDLILEKLGYTVDATVR